MLSASKYVATQPQNTFMWKVIYFLSVHKWTFTQAGGLLLTLPVFSEAPEGVAGAGVLTFLFACWKQYEDVKIRKREMKIKEEWAKERIETVRALREGKLKIDEEILKTILED